MDGSGLHACCYYFTHACTGYLLATESYPGYRYLVLIVETTPFHLHHYPEKAGRGGVYDCDLAKGCQLFLERRKQMASSFHLRKKYYLQITFKSAESVGAIGNK